jgi:hypothetical protein
VETSNLTNLVGRMLFLGYETFFIVTAVESSKLTNLVGRVPFLGCDACFIVTAMETSDLTNLVGRIPFLGCDAFFMVTAVEASNLTNLVSPINCKIDNNSLKNNDNNDALISITFIYNALGLMHEYNLMDFIKNPRVLIES